MYPKTLHPYIYEHKEIPHICYLITCVKRHACDVCTKQQVFGKEWKLDISDSLEFLRLFYSCLTVSSVRVSLQDNYFLKFVQYTKKCVIKKQKKSLSHIISEFFLKTILIYQIWSNNLNILIILLAPFNSWWEHVFYTMYFHL